MDLIPNGGGWGHNNQAQFNLIYPNQLLGIQALGIQALGIRAVHLLKLLFGVVTPLLALKSQVTNDSNLSMVVLVRYLASSRVSSFFTAFLSWSLFSFNSLTCTK